MISWKGCGLSRANLYLDQAYFRWPGGLGRLKVQFKGFFKVGEGLFFRLALARHVDFKALGDVPVPFSPDGGGEWSFHGHILAQEYRLAPDVALSCPGVL